MFTLRPRRDEDMEALCAIRNRIMPERISEGEMRKWIETARHQSNVYESWVAEATDGTILGYGTLDQGDSMPPGWWSIRVQTHPDHRSKGAGTALYDHFEAIARAGGAAEIESFVRGDDDQALAWAERRGFRNDRLRTESILDLSDWDGSRFAGVIEKAAATGLRFEIHYPTTPETDEFLERLYDQHAETAPDVPIYVPPFPTFETWAKEYRGAGKPKVQTYSVFAYDGDRIVGESAIGLPETEGGPAWTHYTAVRSAYRGRGLALALKLLTIEGALARGVTRMRTNNDPDNPGMLTVNAKLGYVLVPGPRRILKTLKAQ